MLWAAFVVAACGSEPPPAPIAPAPPPASAAPPAPSPPPSEEEDDDEIPDTATDEEPETPSPEPAPAPAPSSASFEQATSTPEPIRTNDDHLHLTDQQLSGPMRGLIAKCKVPPKGKVTIKTAVQFGHAIGVTVIVELPKLKTPKKPTKRSQRAAQKAAKAQQKTIVRVRACFDHAVRELAWPPSRRRDTITTTF